MPHVSVPTGASGRQLTLLRQQAPEAGEGQARPIRFERLSIEEGLSQSTVTCILQDQDGFIWIGLHQRTIR